MPHMNVTVMNHKGGVGKTVTAIHLAAFLAREFGRESTVLVDTDPNEGALEWAARGRLPYQVVGPEDDPGDEEYTVYDSQGRLFGEDLEAAAQMSDLVVVPTTPDVVALNTLMRFIEDLEYVDARAEYRVLLTLVPRWPSRSGARARAALEEGGVPIFEGQVRQRAAFQWAGELGVPVYEVNERRALQGWEDYERVGREVIGKQ
jgi:chromosome partitioning protein